MHIGGPSLSAFFSRFTNMKYGFNAKVTFHDTSCNISNEIYEIHHFEYLFNASLKVITVSIEICSYWGHVSRSRKPMFGADGAWFRGDFRPG